ncbi:sigma 54-interacting transcriptional regulator [Paraglaciecola aestuariivivens]
MPNTPALMDPKAPMPNTINLYIDELNQALQPELDSLVDASRFDLQLISLENLAQPLAGVPILIACENAAKAKQLSQQHQLANQTVYWLLASNTQASAELQSTLHQVIDWRAQGVLNLLCQQATLAQQKQHSEHKLALLSDCLGQLSVTLDPKGNIVDINSEFLAILAEQKVVGKNWLECLDIPSNTAKARMQEVLSKLGKTHSMTRLPPFPIQLGNRVLMVDGFVGPLPKEENLLILRQVASWHSHEWLEQTKQQGTAVTLLLINPDDFAQINAKHGREIGDQILAEIIQSMTDMLRGDDFASRFSGAVFAAHLPDTNEQQGQTLAARMLQMLRNKRFTKKRLSLAFSFGLASLEADEQLGEQSSLELFRRANAALQAARSVGGGKLVSWKPQFDANILANLDRMSGKFSEAPNEDFRLINLQWDIIRLIGNTHSLQTFCAQVCQLLSSGLQSEYTGLFAAQGNQLSLLSSSTELADLDAQVIQAWVQHNLDTNALNNQPIQPKAKLGSSYPVVLPLSTRGQCLAVLVLSWPETQTQEAQKCTEQLLQLAPNLAAALDRIMLLEQDKNRVTVVDKTDSQSHELLFESPAMRTLMQQVQLVAPTDASVLIIGESGTGKEVIAQQIHNLSLNPDKPFITVDCSTIVEHLIESELFGHRKGAFTGATHSQPGKIAQADGGTLFLDEVGELPLDIQSKLLRFVQEKTFIPVGDQRVKKVDVRLVLATNRNLTQEVAEGRFRADLFHRINVFTLNLPVLNARDGDPLLLARHFLAKFSRQYKKDIQGFSAPAIEKISTYSWPGNVRELRNCIMRAVIMCAGPFIEPEHLVVQETNHTATTKPPAPQTTQVSQHSSQSSFNVSNEFSALLEEVVAIASHQSPSFSVSHWLEKQWLNQCLEKWGSLYQVAQQLDLSESTLRRRFAKLNELSFEHQGLAPLTEQCQLWLADKLHNHFHAQLWPSIEGCLHQVVFEQDTSQQHKAKLLNVTQPTLRKIIKQAQLNAS